MSTLRLIVSLLLLIFTMTVLSEDDPAAIEKKAEENALTSSEPEKRTSDSKNPWLRMSPWHFHGYPPYAGGYPIYPGYPAIPAVPQKPVSPLMGLMFPLHVAQSGHPWGIPPHHMPPAADPWHYHPWWNVAHDGHVPVVPAAPTPAQAFRWRYPGHYHDHWHGHYEPMVHHWHWPIDTSTTFYPHKSGGGVCNFDRTFLCWGISYCIDPKTMCDGVYDCPNQFDEYPLLCVAGRRPSVESVGEFLGDQAWMQNQLFNPKRTVQETAKVLKSAESLEEIRWKLGVSEENMNNTRAIFQAAKTDDTEGLKRFVADDKDREAVKYFLKTLMDTGLRIS